MEAEETGTPGPRDGEDEAAAAPAGSFPAPRDGEAPFSRPAGAGPASHDPLPPIRWKLNLVLFLATVVSVFFTGAVAWGDGLPVGGGWPGLVRGIAGGWPFA